MPERVAGLLYEERLVGFVGVGNGDVFCTFDVEWGYIAKGRSVRM